MRPSSELEQLLSAPPYLDDEGFTVRVMARVAERRAGTRVRRRVISAMWSCAAILGAAMPPASGVVRAVVRDVLQPLLAVPFDPARSGAALMSTGAAALTVYGIVLVMTIWGAVALARDDAR